MNVPQTTKELYELLDQRYKQLTDCDRDMTEAEDKRHAMDKTITAINTKLSILMAGVGTVCAAIVGYIVANIFK